MRDRHVVTAFIHRAGRVLRLQRSADVSTFRGLWAGVSGILERGATPLDQALREIEVETGILRSAVLPESVGEPLIAQDDDRRFVVHPLRFAATRDVDVRLDWEHEAFEWADPTDLGKGTTVPKLAKAWGRVAPRAVWRREIARRVRALRDDRESGATTLALEAFAILGDAGLGRSDHRWDGERELIRLACGLTEARPSMPVIASAVAAW